MPRDTQQPTTSQQYGRTEEEHPAWVLVGASRVSSSPPGKALFDSDIRHQHYVVVQVQQAVRQRDLQHDWLHARGPRIVEFAMSEAQWASFVSSMNVGDGVPATLETRDGVDLPGVPYDPRLRESMADVESAAQRAQEDVLAAFAAYTEHKTAGNLRSLQAAIENLPANLAYAAKSLSEHAENVVQRSRADIEAFVLAKAQQLGLQPGDVSTDALQLGAGSSEEVV